MSAPMPSVPSATGFANRLGRAYPTALFMFERGLCTIVPRTPMIVGEVDAVDQQPLIGAQRPQPIGRLDVVRSFGDVDVHADAMTHGEVGCSGQRLVGARERRMHADHPPATARRGTGRSRRVPGEHRPHRDDR